MVAQLAEHRLSKPNVVGSTPIHRLAYIGGSISDVIDLVDPEPGIVGSNPTGCIMKELTKDQMAKLELLRDELRQLITKRGQHPTDKWIPIRIAELRKAVSDMKFTGKLDPQGY